jgi:hypothetical protein
MHHSTQNHAREVGIMAERITRIGAVIVSAMFLVTGVVYLYLGSYPATHADFWSIYEFYFQHSWLETALQKYGAHSLFFPNFFWLASVRFFHGSQQPLIFIGLALLLVTTALLLASVWRDTTVGPTAKIVSTMIVVAGNFWMGRWAIILSGGFNSQNSLTMAAVALSLLLIPNRSRSWLTIIIIICAGFIASFSCGQGFAIWPTLLFLAWGVRLRWPSIVAIGTSTVAAFVIYELLPPHAKDYGTLQNAVSSGTVLLSQLCQLIGSPVASAMAAWHGGKTFMDSEEATTAALWSGVVGLALAAAGITPRVVRRDLGKSSLETMGMGLVVFNVAVMPVIMAGRAQLFQVAPGDVLAPRYLYWSSLFWTGLFCIAIQRAEQRRWSRWTIITSAFAAAVFIWPEHYLKWFHGKTSHCFVAEGATAVLNGVVDDNEQFLSLDPKRIARVAPRLRAHRLDMFADGLQDWIGRDQINLFGDSHRAAKLQGTCTVAKVIQSNQGAPAARVVCHATTRRRIPRLIRWAITPLWWLVGPETKKGYVTPSTFVIIDSNRVVRGVARSCELSALENRVLFQGELCTSCVLGYISDYNPQLQYIVRSADDNVLSEETIPVRRH